MDLNFEKLYDITFPLAEDRIPLYFQGSYQSYTPGEVLINKGDCLDIGTYFNLFSVKKWTDLTTLSKLSITLNLIGTFSIEFYKISIYNNLIGGTTCISVFLK